MHGGGAAPIYKGSLEMVVPCCDVFGKGTGRIWLSGVKCLGTEPSITMFVVLFVKMTAIKKNVIIRFLMSLLIVPLFQ